jgi:pSer/pThr/pTyr-binding forkhead associated (FHA) protein
VIQADAHFWACVCLERGQKMDVVLVMFTETGERRDFPIEGKAVVGRDSDSTLQIPLAEISRRHCQVSVKKDKVTVRDLGSSNGTYVNKKRIQQATLKPGDTLKIGPVVFTVVIGGEPEEINPIRTIVEGQKDLKRESKPAKAKDDTGSFDLEDSGELKLELDEEESVEEEDDSSLAALEELSKQRKGKP